MNCIRMTTKIYDAICEIEQEKKERKVFPTYALYSEIIIKTNLNMMDVNTVLNELFKAGFISVGDTVNEKYITTETLNGNK